VTGFCKGGSEKADGDVRKTEREEKEEEGGGIDMAEV
jgi:hypothetical protein